MGNNTFWPQIDTGASYHIYYRCKGFFSWENSHIFWTFQITRVVSEVILWYFRLRRPELRRNVVPIITWSPERECTSFLLKSHNKHSRPYKIWYPRCICLLNTTSRHIHCATHDTSAANTLSEPCMACRPYLPCSLSFNKLGIIVFRPFTSTDSIV